MTRERAPRRGLARRFLLASFAAVLLLAASIGASRAEQLPGEERIEDFASRIVVGFDGTLDVTETITIDTAGREVKRGIFRDFPTEYDGPLGTRVRVPFEVASVERDGRPEPFEAEGADNGVRIRIGDPQVLLPTGRHVYVIRYRTGHQLGFFDDQDELYWNVTGNGWRFPIDRARAEVVLPFDARRQDVTLEGYTGPAGSKEAALRARVDDSTGTLRFETTRPLDVFEGLTIVAGFPKGFVRPPSEADRRGDWLRANRHLLAGWAGLAAVLLYYLGAWLRVGRDPPRGTVIPLFEAPEGLDPAGLRYVHQMAWDDRCLSAALVDLGVKGWVRIEEKDGTFTIRRDEAKTKPLSGPERALHQALLGGRDSIALVRSNHERVRAAVDALRSSLEAAHHGPLFHLNRSWLWAGIALSVLSVLAVGWFSPVSGGFPAMGFMTIWLVAWTFACWALLGAVRRYWRDAVRPGRGILSRAGAVVGATLFTAFAIPFVAAEIAALVAMGRLSSAWAVPMLVLLVGVNLLLAHLLKQPTVEGRKVMDGIEGFRMYLSATDGHEMRQAGPRTPEVFEAMLPYAIALGVEHAWTERFADVLREAASASPDGRTGPRWYSGTSGSSWGDVGGSRFGSMVGSALAGAISSSSVAPGSSSGGGGGGSSGRGGGGGGGGGW
ncbi:MAG: DUF2207 domain-containing protein, partial [Alphaproteobacteria bacterium]